MKFDLELLKFWSINSNPNIIINHFISNGFESFIDNKKINIDVPYNKHNFLNLFSVLGNFLNLFYLNSFRLRFDFKVDIEINLKAIDFCPIFNGIVIKNINSSIETPFFIKQVLIDNDLSFTSNIIIDIINYVTFITGQPLHAYDLNNLDFPLTIDRIKFKKKIITLNSNSLDLESNVPVIEDSKKIISFPGIIGCSNTMIKDSTKNIFLESAFFNPVEIFNLSNIYNIKTHSTSLFSNTINPNFSIFSLIYSSFLFKNLTDSVSSNLLEKKIKIKNLNDSVFVIKKKQIIKTLGFKISDSLIYKKFKELGFPFRIFNFYVKINIPFYRRDISTKENLISEFLRVYGYKNLPCIPINFSIINKFDNLKIDSVCNYLISLGFFEVINYTFVESETEIFLHPNEKLVYIKNPMSNRMNVLRFNLLQGLLKVVKTNINRGNDNFCFFETGSVFSKKDVIIEKKSLAGICSKTFFLNNFGFDTNKFFFVFKKIVENICVLYFSKDDFIFSSCNFKYSSKFSLSIFIDNFLIADFSILDDSVLNFFDINQSLYFFQIYLENSFFTEKKNYKKISKYQKVKRDISIIVKNNILYDSVIFFIKNLKINILKSFFVLDVYSLIDNNKSFTIRFVLQSFIKTLLEEEIRFVFVFLREKIKKKFKAVIKK